LIVSHYIDFLFNNNGHGKIYKFTKGNKENQFNKPQQNPWEIEMIPVWSSETPLFPNLPLVNLPVIEDKVIDVYFNKNKKLLYILTRKSGFLNLMVIDDESTSFTIITELQITTSVNLNGSKILNDNFIMYKHEEGPIKLFKITLDDNGMIIDHNIENEDAKALNHQELVINPNYQLDSFNPSVISNVLEYKFLLTFIIKMRVDNDKDGIIKVIYNKINKQFIYEDVMSIIEKTDIFKIEYYSINNFIIETRTNKLFSVDIYSPYLNDLQHYNDSVTVNNERLYGFNTSIVDINNDTYFAVHNDYVSFKIKVSELDGLANYPIYKDTFDYKYLGQIGSENLTEIDDNNFTIGIKENKLFVTLSNEMFNKYSSFLKLYFYHFNRPVIGDENSVVHLGNNTSFKFKNMHGNAPYFEVNINGNIYNFYATPGW